MLVKTFFLEMEPGKPEPRGWKRACCIAEQRRRHRGVRRPGLARLHLRLERRPDRRRTADIKGVDREYTIKTDGGGETQADLALPQPGRMHHVPHGTAKYALGVNTPQMNQRPRLRRRGRQPTGDAGTHRPVHQASCPSRRRSWRSWPITATTNAEPRRPGPRRTCTPTAATATASGAAATPSSSCWPRCR